MKSGMEKRCRRFPGGVASGGLAFCVFALTWAAGVKAAPEDAPKIYDRIVVVASASAVKEIGGSAHYLSADVLDRM